MKRILLLSIYVIASIVMISCTDDTAPTTQSNTKATVVATESGDPLLIPPPKP
ncbi:hypothetical protein [Flavobacterium nackdongense]|uniref:hypothetical protein n=1 Tax=Flavobacterium nackdongense TaxID=2547394 RepID=UPI0013FD013E|nr:hypothetical protein [Flavobacterium nackdongense]